MNASIVVSAQARPFRYRNRCLTESDINPRLASESTRQASSCQNMDEHTAGWYVCESSRPSTTSRPYPSARNSQVRCFRTRQETVGDDDIFIAVVVQINKLTHVQRATYDGVRVARHLPWSSLTAGPLGLRPVMAARGPRPDRSVDLIVTHRLDCKQAWIREVCGICH